MPDQALSPVNNDTTIARRRTIGGLIRSIREIAGRKPKDIADFVGVTAAAVNSFESGEREPSLPQLEAIAHYLRVPVHTLLGLTTLTTAERPPANLQEILRLRGHIIGARLKQARMARGEGVSETANTTGISSAALQNYELGKKQPSISELEALMAHFGMTVDDLLDLGVGPLGEAQLMQRQRAQFETLSEDVRSFVCDPKSLTHLHMAMRLAGLSPDALNKIATSFVTLAEEAAAARNASARESIG